MSPVRKIPGELPVAFRYTPGVGNTAFFEALADRGVFLGSRCDECGVTYVPARIFCERCFAVDVDGAPLAEPETIGLVRLDGADTVLLHRLVDAHDPSIGMRVEAVLRPAEERTASIDDLRGFAAA
jgi:uncharacterized OB-fold protein